MEMSKQQAIQALQMLDQKLTYAQIIKVQMVVGGGAAMVLQYGFSGMTEDIDAVPQNIDFEDIKKYVNEVAEELGLQADWLNPYFQAFMIYLPPDTMTRMQIIFEGKTLIVKSLGAEDILIMKLMAGRGKDVGHTRHLFKRKDLNIALVEKQLNVLLKVYPKIAQQALDRLDDFLDE